MEIYVLVLVRGNIARRINYAPERVHMFPYQTNNLFITHALQYNCFCLGHIVIVPLNLTLFTLFAIFCL